MLQNVSLITVANGDASKRAPIVMCERRLRRSTAPSAHSRHVITTVLCCLQTDTPQVWHERVVLRSGHALHRRRRPSPMFFDDVGDGRSAHAWMRRRLPLRRASV